MPDQAAQSIAPYARVPKWILILGKHATLVFVTLDSFASDGVCFPGHAAIADRAGISVTSVKQGITDLENSGAVVVQRRPDSTNVYDLRPAFSTDLSRAAPYPWAGSDRPRGVERPTLSRLAPDPGAPSAYEREVLDREVLDRDEVDRPAASATEPIRLDVEQVCSSLAAHVAEQRNGRTPKVGDAWRRDARLLLDLDGVDLDDALRIVEWLRGPGGARFWSPHILSAAKLRSKFPALRAEAARSNGSAPTGFVDHVARARDLADRLEAQGR